MKGNALCVQPNDESLKEYLFSGSLVLDGVEFQEKLQELRANPDLEHLRTAAGCVFSKHGLVSVSSVDAVLAGIQKQADRYCLVATPEEIEEIYSGYDCSRTLDEADVFRIDGEDIYATKSSPEPDL